MLTASGLSSPRALTDTPAAAVITAQLPSLRRRAGAAFVAAFAAAGAALLLIAAGRAVLGALAYLSFSHRTQPVQ